MWLQDVSRVRKPVPHGTKLSMFTNNHHKRVAALTHVVKVQHIWSSSWIKKKKKKMLKCSYWSELYWYTSVAAAEVLSSVILWRDRQNCSQKFVKWGHSLAPESRLYSLKLFEPLFLSVMQLFHLVALFSSFTFVLLSVEDAWLAEFNSLFFFY